MDCTSLLQRHGRLTRQKDNFGLAGKTDRWEVQQPNMGPLMAEYCIMLRNAVTSYECPDPDENLEEPRALGTLVARPESYMPIIIDLNLKYTENPLNPYDDMFCRFIVRAIQQGIVETFEVDDADDSEQLTCIVLEWPKSILVADDRPGYQSCYLYKIRFQFPYCRVDVGLLARLLPVVSTNLRLANAFGCLDQSPIGDWDTILKPFITDSMGLYGSSEKPEHPMLTHSAIYTNMTGCNDEELLTVDTCAIDEVFSIEKHSQILTGAYNRALFNNFTSEDLLPMFLFHNYVATTVKPREHVNAVQTPQNQQDIPREFGTKVHHTTPEKTKRDIMIELLPLIATSRYTDKVEWLSIGKALSNTYEGNQEGLTIWINETERNIRTLKRPPPFLENENVHDACYRFYDSFELKNDLTVKTIAWYAMHDNPDAYKRWHKEWSTPYMEAALDGSHNSVSKALYTHLWLNYACSSPSQKITYEFRGNRWVKIDGGYTIRLYISNEFIRVFEEIRAKVTTHVATSNDQNYKARAEETISTLCSLIAKLGNRTFKNQVMLDLLDRIMIEDFEEFIDANHDVTGHPNGVTEVSYEDAYIKFRPGKPEDYVSRTTLAKLNLDLHWNHHLVVELMTWLGKMFTNEETRKWVLMYFSSGFIGGNLDKLLVFFSGDKNNGKSTLSRLLMKTWGLYGVKFPCSGLTRGYSDSGAANPAWNRLDHARWAVADEFDEGEYLRNGPYKLVSGNDPFFNRGLYKDGKDIDPTASVLGFTNRVPPFRGADEAVKERHVLVPVLSTWMKEGYPLTEEEQYAERKFPMDKDFINKVRYLNTAMLWVSYQYFPLWARNGLDKKPEEIVTATHDYWMENDIYLMYTSDRIEEGEDTDFLTVTQVYNDFEVWFSKFNKGQPVPERPTMRSHLVQRWGPVTNNTWWGIKLVPQEAGPVPGAPGGGMFQPGQYNQPQGGRQQPYQVPQEGKKIPQQHPIQIVAPKTVELAGGFNGFPTLPAFPDIPNIPNAQGFGGINITGLGLPGIDDLTGGRGATIGLVNGKITTQYQEPIPILTTIPASD